MSKLYFCMAGKGQRNWQYSLQYRVPMWHCSFSLIYVLFFYTTVYASLCDIRIGCIARPHFFTLVITIYYPENLVITKCLITNCNPITLPKLTLLLGPNFKILSQWASYGLFSIGNKKFWTNCWVYLMMSLDCHVFFMTLCVIPKIHKATETVVILLHQFTSALVYCR